MFAWGSTIHGELGLGGIEQEIVLTPTQVDWPLADQIVEVACGDNHTLILTNEGKVYSCGSNDYGQLGHDQPRKRPNLVKSLEAQTITHIACGATHSMALNQWGQIFTWGSDTYGQLGHQLGQSMQPVPKILKALATHHVVQIACGYRHSAALTINGEIYCWGANNFGQLGIGTVSPSEPSPTQVPSIDGIPIAFLACGSYHTLVVSKSGAVFGWGNNTRGQLGLNDVTSKSFPTQLRTLRNIKVRYICCGEEFSTFLTLDGGVFTCGAGMYGQLGHGNNVDEILPKKILELMGSTVSQIACGKRHTLAYVPSRGRIYSFGLGGSGQLGIRKTGSSLVPQVVHGQWVSPRGSSAEEKHPKGSFIIRRIFAGGDHCFATVTTRENSSPYDCRVYPRDTQILTLNREHLKSLFRVSSKGTVDQDMITYIETVFKSLSCLNGSFLIKSGDHYACSSKRHGVDLEEAEKTFSIIAKIDIQSIKDLIWNGVSEDLLRRLVPSPPDVEALRIYLTLPFYHEFQNPKHHPKLHKPFASALLKLKQQPQRVIRCWYTTTSSDYFEKLVSIFKGVALFVIRNQKIPENKTIFYDASLVASLDLLAFLNKLNYEVDGFKVPADTFCIPEIGESLDVRIDYLMWLNDATTGRLFLCNYPFIFDAQAKTQLLEADQSIQMQSAMNAAAQQAFSNLFFTGGRQAIRQFLFLNVSREHIVQDTLRELMEVNSSDLKKPLKVKFHGEEAEDAGGVKKEFFMLVLREILDPKYGMFQYYDETRTIWFSEQPFEDNVMYLLIGIICGLAIYNFTIINISFPLALYKKLLHEPIGLADLKGLSPTMANSLKSLLDYEEPDVQEVFGLNFEITREIFGHHVTVPLKPNGEKIPVTQENKEEFVNLYVDYIFNKSVESQYQAFSNGFLKVCGGRVLQLFHSHELQAVVVGNENYDWHALEEAAEYKNGYTSSDPTIRMFWEVIHEIPVEDKKKFLLFLTGSDRIPIQGMKAIKIYIQPTTDDKYLPVAHTCFNLLDLPRYKTKERLKYKLLQAIKQTEGFSLV
ncbi:probable E3 ubiquitin-protein ligase HERC4 [Agrilus planipennis]|uniref:Probable E3 ubiquitin-protein ligase HERC4 n=1 Tax=Agrilus planipennis TaxID=224129 RepID=A0A1W4X5Q9_AGRPL|nr:probable E3 ubiquitin-protein ligase HERC4 [Agrilus planipennis]